MRISPADLKKLAKQFKLTHVTIAFPAGSGTRERVIPVDEAEATIKVLDNCGFKSQAWIKLDLIISEEAPNPGPVIDNGGPVADNGGPVPGGDSQ